MEWQILGVLDEAQRREVLRAAVRRRYRDDDSLFHESDPGDSLHLLARGHVAIRIVGSRGDVLTLEIVGPGGSFGEQSVLQPDARRTASAVAIGDVETLMLSGEQVRELRRRHHGIDAVLVELLAAQVRRLSDLLMDAHTLPADQRVLKQLRRLARAFNDGDLPGVNVPVTQEELASLAGTTRPTANRALQPLVRDGVVALRRGHIVVVDVARLDAPDRA